MRDNLLAGFLGSVASFPDRVALEVGGASLTFQELHARAAEVAALLDRVEKGGPPLTAVFGYRSVTAYVGVVAALLRGHGYVPLNRTFPVGRTARMLQRSGCRAVIVDDQSVDQLDEVLEGNHRVTTLVLPGRADVGKLQQRYPHLCVFGAGDLTDAEDYAALAPPADGIAYLLFTSGSTGEPKGVMVSHRNVTSFVDWAVRRYDVRAEDRFSQTFDLTFDLSAFDMFVAWDRGACVCCPSQKALINPGQFIRNSGITVWFSVPSTGAFMRRLGALKPERYPTLRWSLFCGEPLPVEVASAWQDAAPNSVVENLYGPTEATIACTVYRWDPAASPAESVHSVVPIGEPIDGMSAVIVDQDLRPVPPSRDGELLLTGQQVTPGYWQDLDRTSAAFVKLPGSDAIHYRTGDRVRRNDARSPLVYLGRMDHQIQILGHRVELGEIEAVLREESGEDAVIAVGWPVTSSGASGVVAFIGNSSLDADQILGRAARRLPDYMLPRSLYFRDGLPLNTNGKLDRKALMRELEEIV